MSFEKENTDGSLLSSGANKKRKLTESSSSTSEDKDNDESALCSKQLKLNMLNNEHEHDFKFNRNSRFVLGKNVNEMFAKYQLQHTNGHHVDSTPLAENNNNTNGASPDEAATTNESSNNNNNKTIYAKYPSLFRYEADKDDRQWLNENLIIKKKNHKCFLLSYDEIDELFKATFKFPNRSEIEEENNTTQTPLKVGLKPFGLPDFILNKLNRQYFLKQNK